MTRFILIIISLLCVSQWMDARTIAGVVLSGTDSTAVAGANCQIIADGKTIAAASADADGVFSLNTDVKKALQLKVSMTGFSPTDIIIESGAGNLNIGRIYLDEGIALNEVTVSGNAIVESKGRTIVYPSGADLKASSSALSLFSKLPLNGLEANPINRTITVDGGTPVILINGVPSTINDFNALQPKDIEKIEFSRITPARYADTGASGLINITLKKRTDGGSVSAWARSAVNTAFVDATIYASYHQGHSQFSLQYEPSWRNYQQVYDNITQSYIGDDFRVDLEEHDRNPFYYHYHEIRAKYDYSPSSKTLFSATFNATPSVDQHRSIARTDDSALGQYDNYNESHSKQFSPSLDLFLRQDFNDKNSLEVQLVGTLSSNDYRRDNNYTFADGAEEAYIMNVDSRRRSLISEISYIHNFGQNTSLSAGYQNTLSHSTNRYLSSDYEPVLSENNNYVYASLGQTIGRFYLSLSSGAKLYWISNDANKRHFIRNLSSVQASWRISGKWNLVAAFQYSPGIPSLSQLTDYPQQVSPYLVSNGNPDLKVSENFLFQVMPSFRYKKFNASLLMNYRTVNNFVMDDVRYAGDGIFLSQSINARRSWRAWGNLNMRVSDIAGFGANVNLGLSHAETMGADWCHHLTSFNASFTLWWNKGPYTISYWRKIPGKYLSGNVVGKDENGDSLQFEWEPDKHWTLGASWMYMFDKKGTKYPSWSYSEVNPSSRERYIKNNANMIVLSLRYSADFGSIFRTARRNLNNSDNGSSLLKL